MPMMGPPVPAGALWTYPTPQTRLDETDNSEVYMPTASGRVESAWYGSTRTRQVGRSILPAFHGGIDIAPTVRDARGRALDPIFAVADGTVGYINPIGGNSSYGVYIVLLHPDDAGEYFTLYAHLAEAQPGLKEGDRVSRGETIGRMGNTSTISIPVQRSHLHFEFGTVLNSRFAEWYRAQELKPWHGTLHGFNLGNLNPMPLIPYMGSGRRFDLAPHVKSRSVAFRLVVPASGLPDYYVRYPVLWSGGAPRHGGWVMEVYESGTPLQARPATPDESALLAGGTTPLVLDVDEGVLGRNGRRLVIRRSGRWALGGNSERWLDILLYGAIG